MGSTLAPYFSFMISNNVLVLLIFWITLHTCDNILKKKRGRYIIMNKQRIDGRRNNGAGRSNNRDLQVCRGSVLVEFGVKLICTASIDERVPMFKRIW